MTCRKRIDGIETEESRYLGMSLGEDLLTAQAAPPTGTATTCVTAARRSWCSAAVPAAPRGGLRADKVEAALWTDLAWHIRHPDESLEQLRRYVRQRQGERRRPSGSARQFRKGSRSLSAPDWPF